MKSIRLWSPAVDRKITWILVLLFLSFIAFALYSSLRPFWQVAYLESRARNAVTGDELQAWATSLLATDQTGTNLVVSNWRTNFPRQLSNLCRVGPFIQVHEPFEAEGKSFPGWVSASWGSATYGRVAFEIGPTNFVPMFSEKGHKWQPGVYFVKKGF